MSWKFPCISCSPTHGGGLSPLVASFATPADLVPRLFLYLFPAYQSWWLFGSEFFLMYVVSLLSGTITHRSKGARNNLLRRVQSRLTSLYGSWIWMGEVLGRPLSSCQFEIERIRYCLSIQYRPCYGVSQDSSLSVTPADKG